MILINRLEDDRFAFAREHVVHRASYGAERRIARVSVMSTLSHKTGPEPVSPRLRPSGNTKADKTTSAIINIYCR